jgi:hypothetical protein
MVDRSDGAADEAPQLPGPEATASLDPVRGVARRQGLEGLTAEWSEGRGPGRLEPRQQAELHRGGRVIHPLDGQADVIREN